MTSYTDFLASKAQWDGGDGFEPTHLPDYLFDFQRHLVDWSIRTGRSAILADCGLGKGPMALVWAENVRRHTGKPVLIVTPLAVSFQFVTEAEKFGIDAAAARRGEIPSGITITNYERLEHFDSYAFGGVVCDESSAIKCFDGVRRMVVTEFMRTVPYRLLCTATAAPNDYFELGTSSEALGYLGHMDMLGRFFTNKERTSRSVAGRWKPRGGDEWRFKGHAEQPFWRWVSSWARAVRKPSDLGFDDGKFQLPELINRKHIVTATRPREGTLFDIPGHGLSEEREAARRTLAERCEKAAELLTDASPGIAWCQLNDEGALLTKIIDGAVEVSGSDDVEEKEENLAAFGRGEIRVLVIKPKIGAYGLNWQHCHQMTYMPSHSFEQAYQSIRRCWRFGQEHPVTVDMITTEVGASMLANLERKAAQADRMFDGLTAHMRDALTIQRDVTYNREVQVPQWLAS